MQSSDNTHSHCHRQVTETFSSQMQYYMPLIKAQTQGLWGPKINYRCPFPALPVTPIRPFFKLMILS